MPDVARHIQNLGYSIGHEEDITERDVEIGWKALDRKLAEYEEEFAMVLGKDWVREAHKKFENEISAMQEGRWGNGRIVATKSGSRDAENQFAD